MDSQLKIDRDYIEAEINQFGGKEEDRLMKLLK